MPDAELGELPGVCAHYVIDRDGTVYQLVPTSIMCRHTVGLNCTAIGIEHVGRTDGQVLGNPRQFGLAAPDAHASGPLSDPHAQRDRPQREPLEPVSPRARRAASHQTHGDFLQALDGRYRAPLERLPAPASLR